MAGTTLGFEMELGVPVQFAFQPDEYMFHDADDDPVANEWADAIREIVRTLYSTEYDLALYASTGHHIPVTVCRPDDGKFHGIKGEYKAWVIQREEAYAQGDPSTHLVGTEISSRTFDESGESLADASLEIRAVFQTLQAHHCEVGGNCGFHIHGGYDDLDHLKTIVAMMAVHMGEIRTLIPEARLNSDGACKPFGEIEDEDIEALWSIGSIDGVKQWIEDHTPNASPNDRNLMASVRPELGTVEFRAFAATLDADEIINHLNFFADVITQARELSHLDSRNRLSEIRNAGLLTSTSMPPHATSHSEDDGVQGGVQKPFQSF
jgi:hypothetical protein